MRQESQAGLKTHDEDLGLCPEEGGSRWKVLFYFLRLAQRSRGKRGREDSEQATVILLVDMMVAWTRQRRRW